MGALWVKIGVSIAIAAVALGAAGMAVGHFWDRLIDWAVALMLGGLALLAALVALGEIARLWGLA